MTRTRAQLVVVCVALVVVAMAAMVSAVEAQRSVFASEEEMSAYEHAGIMRDLLASAERDAAFGSQQQPPSQEPITNAQTTTVGGGGGASLLTELAASAQAHAQAQSQSHTRSGHRVRNRHLARGRARSHARGGARQHQTWPEFAGGENEGKDANAAAEDAMQNYNKGELTPADAPAFPERFIAWFVYGPKRAKRRMRGRFTYDYKERLMQVDYFPGQNRRETYFFNYQTQVRQLYKMMGVMDPTRRSYKKALKKQAERRAAIERGEDVKPEPPGSNALKQEDMLVLENEDYVWDECVTWDLTGDYAKMCPTDCFTGITDASVGTFPDNPIADESTMDLFAGSEESPKIEVLVYMTGYIPGRKEGEDNEETGQRAYEHPALHVRYSAYRNQTITEIELGPSVWTFFRWEDMSDWNNFDLKDSGVFEALTKPNMNCVYSGAVDKDVEEVLQKEIPIPMLALGGGED